MESSGFWIEGNSGESGRWRVDGSTLYLGNEVEQVFQWQYSIAGNKFTYDIQECEYDDYDDDECHEVLYKMTLTRVELAYFRNTLGLVYYADPALTGSWYLTDGGESYLSFHGGEVNGDGVIRYLGGNTRDGYYYTIGGTLYLIGVNCVWYGETERCTVTNTVQKTYSVTGSGGNGRLTIGDDYWSAYDYYYSLAKSGQSKKTASNSKSVFALLSKSLVKKR